MTSSLLTWRTKAFMEGFRSLGKKTGSHKVFSRLKIRKNLEVSTLKGKNCS